MFFISNSILNLVVEKVYFSKMRLTSLVVQTKVQLYPVVVSSYIVLYYDTLYYTSVCYVMLCCTVLCYVALCHVADWRNSSFPSRKISAESPLLAGGLTIFTVLKDVFMSVMSRCVKNPSHTLHRKLPPSAVF